MKKLILAFVCLATIAFVSCKGKQDAATENQTEVIEEVQSTDVEVPNFDDEKLGEYMNLYDSYIEEYKGAISSKDMSKFQELATKGQEFATKGQELLSSGLSESDAKKLQDYMTKKAEELQELAQKMMN